MLELPERIKSFLDLSSCKSDTVGMSEASILIFGDKVLKIDRVNEESENDKISGFPDLGKTGCADRYQDIALCYRSLKHNYEGKYSETAYAGFDSDNLFKELGIEPDWEKIRYYILLDELF